jgi:hypothetical protein
MYDLFRLPVLQLPVRCRYCRERYYLNFLSALKLYTGHSAPVKSPRMRLRRHKNIPAQAEMSREYVVQ